MLMKIIFWTAVTVLGFILMFSDYPLMRILGTFMLGCVLVYLGWLIWSCRKAEAKFNYQQSRRDHNKSRVYPRMYE